MGQLQGSSIDRRLFNALGAARMDGTICLSAGASASGAHLPERVARDRHRDRGRGRARGGVGGQHGLHPSPLLALLPPSPGSGVGPSSASTPSGPKRRERPTCIWPRGPAVTVRSHSGCSMSSSPRDWRTPSSSPSGPWRGRAAGTRHGLARGCAPPGRQALRPTPSRTSPAGWRRPGPPSSSSDRAPSATPTPARPSGPSSVCPPSPARGVRGRGRPRPRRPHFPRPGHGHGAARAPPQRRPAPGRQPGPARASAGRRVPSTTTARSPRCASPTPTPPS